MNPLPSTSSSLGVTSIREFNATRETLFAAFACSENLLLWWGPRGFRNTFQKFDFRAGGEWRFTMHGPDGNDYPNLKTFVEISPPERIVFDHVETLHSFRMTMTFERSPTSTGTRVTWDMRFAPGHADAALIALITQANEENLDRLHAHIAAKGLVAL